MFHAASYEIDPKTAQIMLYDKCVPSRAYVHQNCRGKLPVLKKQNAVDRYNEVHISNSRKSNTPNSMQIRGDVKECKIEIGDSL